MIEPYWMVERLDYVEDQIKRHQYFVERRNSFNTLVVNLEHECHIDREARINLSDYAGGMWIWAAEVAYVVGYNDGINRYEPESKEYKFNCE